MSHKQYQQFRGTVEALVVSDSKTSLFEFVVRHHLLMHLDRRFEHRRTPRVKFNKPAELKREIELMLSAFASASVTGSVLEAEQQPDDAVVLEAYRLAMQVAGFGDAADSTAELESWEVVQLEECMQRLHHAAPMLKKQFLHAAAVLIAFDSQITIAEAEFFRAVAESLDCPVPVFAAGRLKSEVGSCLGRKPPSLLGRVEPKRGEGFCCNPFPINDMHRTGTPPRRSRDSDSPQRGEWHDVLYYASSPIGKKYWRHALMGRRSCRVGKTSFSEFATHHGSHPVIVNS